MQPTSPQRFVMPRLVSSPVGALRPWPIDIFVARRWIQVPALPAADWLDVLMADPLEPDAIFPGLADADDVVDDALLAGQLTFEDLNQIILDCVSMASSRPWYVTFRLVYTAMQGWDSLGADMAMKGPDPLRVSLAAWLDVLHHVILDHLEPKNVTMFHSRLELPPPGHDNTAPQELEMSRDQFLGMMAN